MNPNQHSKLNRRAKEQAVGKNHSEVGQTVALEFGSPEDMLRHDAAQTEVPDRVAERLRQSIQQEPPRPRSWWQRLFGHR
jgi:hypothetical protein